MRRGSDRIEKQSMEIKDGAGVEAEEVAAMKYSGRELEVGFVVLYGLGHLLHWVFTGKWR